jgi:hypothetical protein
MFSRTLKSIISLFLVASIGILAGCTSTASPTATATRTTIPAEVGYVQIVVNDAANNPLTGAKVVSQSQPGSQLSVNGITANGSVTFGPIAPGSYQFAISQANFQSTVAAVEVIGGQSIQITIGLQKSN